jgi:Lhr-like helicase
MIKQFTKKEYHAAIKTLRASYKHGELSEKAFRRLVKIVASVYYGQKMDKILQKYWG